uniref:Uncharacterized protein n=1 Tax=Arundo donax TaxID=35708 RepID=A0A0A9A7W9_ARUDO
MLSDFLQLKTKRQQKDSRIHPPTPKKRPYHIKNTSISIVRAKKKNDIYRLGTRLLNNTPLRRYSSCSVTGSSFPVSTMGVTGILRRRVAARS